MKNLTLSELINTNGGCEGTAYEVGQAIGYVIKFVGILKTVKFGVSIFKRIF